jgi:N-methylhydantoinase A
LATKRVQIGIDVGGTFTDVVALDGDGAYHTLKTLSTPEDQSIGVLNGLKGMLARLALPSSTIGRLSHGTTVATNALLEGKGGKTALLTTRGFRDVLHIGRQNRPNLYDLKPKRPEPLVPRRFRYGVQERARHTGAIEQPLDEEQVAAICAELETAGIESVAVCFLHAYANPDNERAAARVIRKLLPGAYLSLSTDLLPEFREFERMSTTVLNATVQPVVARYITNLVDRLEKAGVKAPLNVMQSNGGMMPAGAAAGRSVNTLLSGPAGGVLGAAHLAEASGFPNCITADVGGTSFDVATIINGQPAMGAAGQGSENQIAGYAVKIPHFDIHTIGAGGGSIAWIDSGGALRVGPESAGARPGPACYGQGGVHPTVTDAHAVLGHFGGAALQDGALQLDLVAARKVIQSALAGPLDNSVEAAAEGILRVVNARMSRAIRLMTVERGLDPRSFLLIPFGGAGPLHAVAIARSLSIPRVLIPPAPGNFSAFGLLTAPIRTDGVASCFMSGDEIDFPTINQRYALLQGDIGGRFAGENRSVTPERYERHADLRFMGQSVELTVPVPDGPIQPAVWRSVQQSYHQLHKRIYGFTKPEDPIELVNLRLSAFGPQQTIKSPNLPLASGPPVPAASGRIFSQGRWIEASLFERERLRPAQQIDGPAIILEPGSTLLIGQDDSLTVDRSGNLLVDVAGGA